MIAALFIFVAAGFGARRLIERSARRCDVRVVYNRAMPGRSIVLTEGMPMPTKFLPYWMTPEIL
jgi:hypothetical protein